MSWIIIFICVFVSFVFSGIESGVLSMNRIRLRHHARTGNRSAQQLELMLRHLEQLMVTVVLVTSTANILTIAFLFQEFAKLYGEKGAIVGIAISAPCLIIMMEFLPKAIFRRFPYRALVHLAKILAFVHMILRPFVAMGVWVMGLLTAGRGWKPQQVGSVENIHRHISNSATPLTATEKQMIDNVLKFRGVTVSDAMIPMEKVLTILPTISVEELFALAKKTDFERFPIMTANGEVLGLIQLTDFLSNGHSQELLISRMRRIVSVQDQESGFSILQKLRAARLTLALVTSHSGKPLGIVSSEDLIRRLLVGAAA